MPLLAAKDLTDFNAYKHATKADVGRLKRDTRVDLHVLFKFAFDDKKERTAIILGPIAKPVADVLKARKLIPKKGKCTLVAAKGGDALMVQGGIPAAKVATVLEQVDAAVKEVVENNDAVDLTTDDPIDPVPAPTAATPTPTAATAAAPTGKPEMSPDLAKARVQDLGNQALPVFGAAPPPVPSKPTTQTAARGLEAKDFGAKPSGADLADRSKGAYKQGAMSAVDVGQQKAEEISQKIKQYTENYTKNLASANEKVVAYTKSLDELKAMKKQAGLVAAGDPKFAETQAIIKQLEASISEITVTKSAAFTDYVTPIKNILAAVKAEKDVNKQYELLQPQRNADIDKVYDQIQTAYAETNRRLVVLGRLKDTHEFMHDASAPEKGRVLDADSWSIAVNDSFMKAGLDQKAEFALLTRFQDKVKAKLKELLKQPGTVPIDKVIADFRAFAKQEADPALWTGNLEHNEGFAVSMREVEQILRDGYVLQEFDPTGAEFAGEGKGTQQVMIPKGIGAKIGGELAATVDARQTAALNKRWDASKANLDAALKTAAKPELEAQAKAFRQAMDSHAWDAAGNAAKAVEDLINQHLIHPRTELKAELSRLVLSKGYRDHVGEEALKQLVKQIQRAELHDNFAEERVLLGQLATLLA